MLFYYYYVICCFFILHCFIHNTNLPYFYIQSCSYKIKSFRVLKLSGFYCGGTVVPGLLTLIQFSLVLFI